MTHSDNGVCTKPIVLTEDDGYALDEFLLPKMYYKYLDKVLIPQGMVRDRVERMAMDIRKAYQGQGEELHCVCILKGSRAFFSMLFEHLSRMSLYDEGASCPPFYEHYIKVKASCGTTTGDESSVRVSGEDLSCLKGKHVLILEDMVRTGNTLRAFTKYLNKFEPKTVRIASLSVKRLDENKEITVHFAGFSIPNHWVVGCSYDCDDFFRDMPHVCTLTPEGIRLCTSRNKSE